MSKKLNRPDLVIRKIKNQSRIDAMVIIASWIVAIIIFGLVMIYG